MISLLFFGSNLFSKNFEDAIILAASFFYFKLKKNRIQNKNNHFYKNNQTKSLLILAKFPIFANNCKNAKIINPSNLKHILEKIYGR